MRARVNLGPANGVSADLAESHLALLSQAFPMDPVVEKLGGQFHLSSSVIDAADLEPGPNFFDVCRAEFFALSTAAAVTFPGLDPTNITIESYQGTIDHGIAFTIGHIAAYGIPATVEQSELEHARLLAALARSREPWARLLSLLSRRDGDTAWFDLYGVYELLSVNVMTNRWVERNTTDLDRRRFKHTANTYDAENPAARHKFDDPKVQSPGRRMTQEEARAWLADLVKRAAHEEASS